MTFNEAQEIVEREFKTRYVAPHAIAIRVNQSYNGYEMFYIELYDDGDEIFLDDGGYTKEYFAEVSEEEWILLCKKHGFEFRQWRILRRFRSNKDVYAFIDFLKAVCDRFDPI